MLQQVSPKSNEAFKRNKKQYKKSKTVIILNNKISD